jgi:CRP/FNR family cyclic AMP-dependent transcriptional regulator
MVKMMMLPPIPPNDHSGVILPEVIQANAAGSRQIELARGEWVYKCGDPDPSIYLVLNGQIRLQVPVSGGGNCLLDICRPGDAFGESCLSGRSSRLESALATESTRLIQIDRSALIQSINTGLRLENLARLLVVRATRYEALITLMRMKDDELRLAMALLHLESIFSAAGAIVSSVEQGALGDQLATIARLRTDQVEILLAKFRELDLIGLTPDRSVAIREYRLRDFVARGDSIDEGYEDQDLTLGDASFRGLLPRKSDHAGVPVSSRRRNGRLPVPTSGCVH